MTVAGFIVLFLILASLGALVVFSLALAHVLGGWGGEDPEVLRDEIEHRYFWGVSDPSCRG